MILLEGLDQRILKDRNEIIKSIKENESKHSFAYFAGWADGDGSFLKNETYVLKIQYEEPLFAFNQLYKTSILLSTPDKREWINESDPRKFVTLSSLRYNHFCENVLPFIVGYKRNKIIMSNFTRSQFNLKIAVRLVVAATATATHLKIQLS